MPYINFEGLISELKASKNARAMLTFHSIGDTDAVSSAISLSGFFPNHIIAKPDAITSNSTRILRKLGFDEHTITSGFPEGIETIVLFDVNNVEGCGKFRGQLERFAGKIIVIDHHKPMEDKPNLHIFSDESYNSTASIVYEIMKRLIIKIEDKDAKLLSMGIMSDSAEFKNATSLTFSQLGELFKIGKTDYITLLVEMEHISPPQERIKTVSDLFNASAFVENGILFVKGNAHSYSNLAADDAIRIGADVALFHSVSKEEVSFSARLRPTLDKKYGIHLGAIMKKLAPIIDGNGGGHPCAAGAYGKDTSKSKEFANAFIIEIQKFVRGEKQ
jgi:nanoRNase/pAp phosphatase (c-di-AMP/oligoRNAs hydrolase)